MICDHCCRHMLAPNVWTAACGGNCCSEECAAALDHDYELDIAERLNTEWIERNLFARQNGGRE